MAIPVIYTHELCILHFLDTGTRFKKLTFGGYLNPYNWVKYATTDPRNRLDGEN